MTLNYQDKKNIIYKIKQIAIKSLSAIIVDYSGITVNQMTELRKIGRKSDINMHIVRNTLMQYVIKNTFFECLKDILIGPNLIVFSNKHLSISAHLLTSFSKKNNKLKIKAAAWEGKIIPTDQLDQLITVPSSYEESIECLIYTIKKISIGKLLSTLKSVCNHKNINL